MEASRRTDHVNHEAYKLYIIYINPVLHIHRIKYPSSIHPQHELHERIQWGGLWIYPRMYRCVPIDIYNDLMPTTCKLFRTVP